VERKDVSDRQLEALLARLDAIQHELARINRRLEANEGFLVMAKELRNLNESLNAIAYAALGQSPQVRRRRTG
jgi:predicted hotdog family 3-hydroxylacyl-ACP dehydratase